jgi:hypothetical protein
MKMAACEELEVYMMHRGQRRSVNMSSISSSAICSLCLSHVIQQGTDEGNGKVKFTLEQAMKA